MRIGDIIERKKRRRRLSDEEIRFVVERYVSGEIPDYQISALLMAVWFAGMDEAETTALTLAMADSGDRIDLSGVDGVPVDKHSTGGVADTTTLIVAPVVAACGGRMAKMSGRGLGHTGGTLDKLEAIPGMRVDLSAEEFVRTVNRCGLSIVGQTGNLVPADKKLYALRDVTATVDSAPLIASSIMSKKLASGASGIVLDVKWGSGAFIKTTEEATRIAHLMTAIGTRAGRTTVALVTDMNQPLGSGVGNALDVAEAISVLRGECSGDLLDVSTALARELLVIAGLYVDADSAEAAARRAIDSGEALARLAAMIEAQHGDPRVVDEVALLPRARRTVSVRSRSGGFVVAIDAERIGSAAQILGAGRARKDDPIDPAVGIVVKKRLGDPVDSGEELAVLHINEEGAAGEANERCAGAFVIGDSAPDPPALIVERVAP